MPGNQKRIPKNSIFIIVKFDSREQVIDLLKDEDYKPRLDKGRGVRILQVF